MSFSSTRHCEFYFLYVVSVVTVARFDVMRKQTNGHEHLAERNSIFGLGKLPGTEIRHRI